jgi:hypothetical protein
MAGPIAPIRRTSRAQRVDGVRRHDACESEAMFEPKVPQLPAVIPQPDGDPDRPAAEAPKPEAGGAAPFAAQLYGQPGVRRGLKGGQEVLDKARATYLSAEYSGPNDRRPAKGRITRTEI